MKPILSILRFFGSMYFAIGLILILAVVLAWATYLGMQFGDDASAWCVYHAGWFQVLCGLLGLSVLISALVRWPWKKRHIGFLVTHLGILVLLAGCWVDFQYGESTHLTVAEGKVNSVVVCPNDFHLDLRWTPGRGKNRKEFHETLRFEPGLFSWRFYGQKGECSSVQLAWERLKRSFFVEKGLAPVPWNWAGRNRAGDQLKPVTKNDFPSEPKIEVLDWMRLGIAVDGQEKPKAVEKFEWEVIHAGGKPKEGMPSKEEIKNRLNDWTSWVKVRVTVDGETKKAWLRQFNYFDEKQLDYSSSSGLKRNIPSESDRTLLVFQSKKGSKVQLVYAQNTVALNFGVQLDRFNNRLDPGTSMASHYSSDVTILDKKMNISMNQPVDISEPKTGQVWRLFQTSYGGPFLNRSARVDQPAQFYTSTFTLRYSPGRGLLYLGCLLVVLGIGIMFSMKAYFFGKN